MASDMRAYCSHLPLASRFQGDQAFCAVNLNSRFECECVCCHANREETRWPYGKNHFLTMLHENMGQKVAVSEKLLIPHYHRMETEHFNEIKLKLCISN